MNSIFDDNTVCMTLGQYLDIRDELMNLRKFRNDLETFARENRCSYNSTKRDVYDIGREVLKQFGLPENLEEEENEDVKAD